MMESATMPDSAVPQPNDLRAFWMPFTANRQFKSNPRMMVSAKDMHYTCLLYTSDAADE